MKAWLASAAAVDFGLCSALAAGLCFVTLLLANAYQRRWGDLGDFALAMTTAGSTVMGIKVMLLTLVLEPANLGALADERAVFHIGGALATAISLRECVRSWSRAAGFPDRSGDNRRAARRLNLHCARPTGEP
ncbi:hypothetical protein [Paraburkholderia phosphatilytica]|uniref:hypothetical protein n=1 Tax=Paraburkholderia phosphatilytica TaxID=2282883 RepID=UPI000F5DB2D0|nr:hypothetical protein [Paraburkholderia phosphatilytica]